MAYRLLIHAASRATGRLGWLRGAIGALLGAGLAGLFTRLALGANPAALPWLVAPIGASAVLVFAVPASPLAQPWPVLGGNMLSALVGLCVAHYLPLSMMAGPVALGMAIAVMSLCRCLHPPGGACALVGALGSTTITEHGWHALMLPLGINVVTLITVGWLYNNFTGHSWPHAPHPVPQPRADIRASSYESSDLDAVLEEWDEVLDVNRDDLDALFRAIERRVQQRRNRGQP